ncbi:hypothetical protein PPERSA_12903 [Pseudocohnilembus persalinus]|uniref:Uncharacterized protein n=1 Tax=Pseudocohnilembus persalinus TaxID=266149 RepID=A0A0V0R1L0_PSEPJ|nr:hypothetical protein PPERSA_12903 [Pseudocohnilembus persalinus]|eukprot:KRX08422.1 hypothetical protein PPERSA_12903 [Pseudocohnilembus persalinus]
MKNIDNLSINDNQNDDKLIQNVNGYIQSSNLNLGEDPFQFNLNQTNSNTLEYKKSSQNNQEDSEVYNSSEENYEYDYQRNDKNFLLQQSTQMQQINNLKNGQKPNNQQNQQFNIQSLISTKKYPQNKKNKNILQIDLNQQNTIDNNIYDYSDSPLKKMQEKKFSRKNRSGKSLTQIRNPLVGYKYSEPSTSKIKTQQYTIQSNKKGYDISSPKINPIQNDYYKSLQNLNSKLDFRRKSQLLIANSQLESQFKLLEKKLKKKEKNQANIFDNSNKNNAHLQDDLNILCKQNPITLVSQVFEEDNFNDFAQYAYKIQEKAKKNSQNNQVVDSEQHKNQANQQKYIDLNKNYYQYDFQSKKKNQIQNQDMKNMSNKQFQNREKLEDLKIKTLNKKYKYQFDGLLDKQNEKQDPSQQQNTSQNNNKDQKQIVDIKINNNKNVKDNSYFNIVPTIEINQKLLDIIKDSKNEAPETNALTNTSSTKSISQNQTQESNKSTTQSSSHFQKNIFSNQHFSLNSSNGYFSNNLNQPYFKCKANKISKKYYNTETECQKNHKYTSLRPKNTEKNKETFKSIQSKNYQQKNINKIDKQNSKIKIKSQTQKNIKPTTLSTQQSKSLKTQKNRDDNFFNQIQKQSRSLEKQEQRLQGFISPQQKNQKIESEDTQIFLKSEEIQQKISNNQKNNFNRSNNIQSTSKCTYKFNSKQNEYFDSSNHNLYYSNKKDHLYQYQNRNKTSLSNYSQSPNKQYNNQIQHHKDSQSLEKYSYSQNKQNQFYPLQTEQTPQYKNCKQNLNQNKKDTKQVSQFSYKIKDQNDQINDEQIDEIKEQNLDQIQKQKIQDIPLFSKTQHLQQMQQTQKQNSNQSPQTPASYLIQKTKLLQSNQYQQQFHTQTYNHTQQQQTQYDTFNTVPNKEIFNSRNVSCHNIVHSEYSLSNNNSRAQSQTPSEKNLTKLKKFSAASFSPMNRNTSEQVLQIPNENLRNIKKSDFSLKIMQNNISLQNHQNNQKNNNNKLEEIELPQSKYISPDNKNFDQINNINILSNKQCYQNNLNIQDFSIGQQVNDNNNKNNNNNFNVKINQFSEKSPTVIGKDSFIQSFVNQNINYQKSGKQHQLQPIQEDNQNQNNLQSLHQLQQQQKGIPFQKSQKIQNFLNYSPIKLPVSSQKDQYEQYSNQYQPYKYTQIQKGQNNSQQNKMNIKQDLVQKYQENNQNEQITNNQINNNDKPFQSQFQQLKQSNEPQNQQMCNNQLPMSTYQKEGQINSQLKKQTYNKNLYKANIINK